MHSIRFVHSSDFHLDRPLGGLTHIPAQLREEFIEAPYLAAERVFDVAENEKVDFVILSGDIVDLDKSGPRAIDFLCRQFHRLQKQSIKVFWIGGQVDDLDLWPVDIPLPKNVHTFSSTHVEEIEFRGKKDRRAALIVGRSFRLGGVRRGLACAEGQEQGEGEGEREAAASHGRSRDGPERGCLGCIG